MNKRLFFFLLFFLSISEGSQKCSAENCFSPRETNSDLMVFASFSLPLQTWQKLSLQLAKANGIFVIQGLPKNSFAELAKKVDELKREGITAPIILDPTAFEKYQIKKVPTILLKDNETHDKVCGNVPLDFALQLFVEKGETTNAITFLKKVKREI